MSSSITSQHEVSGRENRQRENRTPETCINADQKHFRIALLTVEQDRQRDSFAPHSRQNPSLVRGSSEFLGKVFGPHKQQHISPWRRVPGIERDEFQVPFPEQR